MSELNFEHQLLKYDLEKLRAVYIKVVNDIEAKRMNDAMKNVENENINDSDELKSDIYYCPTCNDKLKSLPFDLTDDEIVCDYCVNSSICKIYERIEHVKDEVFLDVGCESFIPDINKIKKRNNG